MLNLFRYGILLALFLTTASCANKKREQFSESFFTYQNDEGKKYFSFILKLDGMQPAVEQNPFENPNGRRTSSNGQDRRVRKEDPVAVPEDPEDILVSLKFRMEEMAHDKLNARLQASNYCPGTIKLDEEIYEKFRYKIKGYCAD